MNEEEKEETGLETLITCIEQTTSIAPAKYTHAINALMNSVGCNRIVQTNEFSVLMPICQVFNRFQHIDNSLLFITEHQFTAFCVSKDLSTENNFVKGNRVIGKLRKMSHDRERQTRKRQIN